MSGAALRRRPPPAGAQRRAGNADGRRAEDLAARWLRRRRVRILQRNYRCRQGEIDLIGLQGGVLLFIEVRLRSSDAWGGAAASVHRGKQRRIIQAAQHFLQSSGGAGRPCRFDVLCAARNARRKIEIVDWVRDAFRED